MKPQVMAGTFLLLAVVRPGYAVAPPIDPIVPWRVQVRVHTCDQPDAGTGSKVFLQLTADIADRFWLARGGNDRARNQRDTYSVFIRDPMVSGSTAVGAITEVTLGIHGSDKWCFDRVELFLNNPNGGEISPIDTAGYRIFDSGTIAGGRWISTGDAGDSRIAGRQVTVASEAAGTLRGRLWNLEGLRIFILHCPRIDGLVGADRAVLEDVFESLLGHMMGPGEDLSDFRFGERAGRDHVTVRRVSDDTIRVDADIVRERWVSGASQRWDKEIVLQFRCNGTRLTVTPLKVDVDAARWMNWLSLAATRGMARLAERIAANRLSLPDINVQLGLCVPPRFTADGDLTLPDTDFPGCCSPFCI